MLRAIPRWRKLGTKKWVEEEEKRYICPKCNIILYRGAQKCNFCNSLVELD